MNDSRDRTSFSERLLQRTGKGYILLVVFISQLATAPLGLFLAAIIFVLNTDFSVSQATVVILIGGGLLLLRNALLLAGAFLFNRESTTRLGQWAKGELRTVENDLESHAWKQMTVFAWRYTGVSFVSLVICVLLPLLIYLYSVIHAAADQIIYTLIAGLAAGLSLEVLEVLIIERLLIPAREALLPHDSEQQLAGLGKLNLSTKYIIIVLALILISILLIAPIGFRQTTIALGNQALGIEILRNLRLQSLAAVILAITIGLGISLLLAQTISQPIRQMVETFNKIEAGNLKQRVPILATDEVGELAVHFNRMVSQIDELQSQLAKTVTVRNEQLKATAEVGRIASSILSPDALTSSVVNMITDQLGFFSAAIFQLDPSGRWAVLSSASGEAGKVQKSQGYKLEVGKMSMVREAIVSKHAVIAQEARKEPGRFENSEPPETYSEITLPLIVGDRAIGVLIVQSPSKDAFGTEDVDTLQGMANQVAIALENARLYQEAQNNLEELRAAQRVYVTNSWTGKERRQLVYDYTASSKEKGEASQGSTVEIPLTLRDQRIGSLTLEGGQTWKQEEQDMVEAVVTQAALALENARLLEESQQIALRERLVAEITSKIWTAPNADFILQTAIKELGRVLHADEAVIELSLGEEQK
jgi:GAF domain-containing protein/HAMP domain-containing protein